MSVDNPIGIDRQRQDCIKLCDGKGWTRVEYTDNDTSASNGKKRPAYERMLTDIETGAIGAVVAWDLDRLHRRLWGEANLRPPAPGAAAEAPAE